jgi:hypothetical protein
VRIGTNAIVGCREDIFLPKGLVNQSRMNGLYTLNRIENTEATSIWTQGWSLVEELGLDVIWNQYWSCYTSELQRDHVHLNDKNDELAWCTQLLDG